MINNPEFADAVFVVEDKTVYAHRGLLAARCSKFQQIFASSKDSKIEIPLPNLRYVVLPLGLTIG
jgi:hypothetical protein